MAIGMGMGLRAINGNPAGLRANSPPLDLNFTDQRYFMSLVAKNFADLITFTRAGSANRINQSGVLETMAANVPRIDYDQTTLVCRGLLLSKNDLDVATINYATLPVSENGSWLIDGELTKTSIVGAPSLTGNGVVVLVINAGVMKAYTSAGLLVSKSFTSPTGVSNLFSYGTARLRRLKFLKGVLSAAGAQALCSGTFVEDYDLMAALGSSGHLYTFGPAGTMINGIDPRSYQDSSGVTIGAVDAPVGLVLDGAGVSIEKIADPTLNSSAGWSLTNWTMAGGTLQATASGSSAKYGIGSATVGKSYQYTITTNTTSAQAMMFYVGGVGVSVGNAGTYTGVVVATGTTLADLYSWGSGATFYTGIVDRVSIKEVTGLHYAQATPGSKPVMRRGIVNALLQSSNYAVWSASGVSYSGQSWIEGSTSARHTWICGAVPIGISTRAARVKRGVGSRHLQFAHGSGAGYVTFNLSTGAIGASGGSGFVSASIALDGDSYVCAAVFSKTVADNAWWLLAPNATDAGLVSYQGDGASSLIVSNAGIIEGMSLTASEIIAYGGIPLATTVAASSSIGPLYVQFDGGDSLGSTFAAGTLGSNMDVFMAVRRDSDSIAMLLYAGAGVNRYAGWVQTGQAGSVVGNSGTAFTVFVDGVQVGTVGSVTAGQLSAAMTVGTYHVVEIRNLDMSAWAALGVGNWNTGYQLTGSVAGIVIAPAMSDENRTVARNVLAEKAWLSL